MHDWKKTCDRSVSLFLRLWLWDHVLELRIRRQGFQPPLCHIWIWDLVQLTPSLGRVSQVIWPLNPGPTLLKETKFNLNFHPCFQLVPKVSASPHLLLVISSRVSSLGALYFFASAALLCLCTSQLLEPCPLGTSTKSDSPLYSIIFLSSTSIHLLPWKHASL